jgi:hypothetical protein
MQIDQVVKFFDDPFKKPVDIQLALGTIALARADPVEVDTIVKASLSPIIAMPAASALSGRDKAPAE